MGDLDYMGSGHRSQRGGALGPFMTFAWALAAVVGCSDVDAPPEGDAGALCEQVDCDDGNPCTDDGTCDPQTGACPEATFLTADAVCGEAGFCDGFGTCVGCSEDNHCGDGEACTVDMCNGSNECVFEPVADETVCDAGASPGQCYQGGCVAVAPDDDVDPVDSIEVDFDRGGIVTVTNRVSYPLGDTEDNVSYRVNETTSLGFFGRLTIKVECDEPDRLEVFFFGETKGCGEIFDRFITDDSGDQGFVRITAIDGGGPTLLEWELKFLTCTDNGNPCFQ